VTGQAQWVATAMTESKVSNMVAAGTAVGEDLAALLQPMKVGPIYRRKPEDDGRDVCRQQD